MSFVFAWATCVLSSIPVHAASALPEDFTVEGRLYDASGTPIATSADFKLELVDELNPTCVLYRELRTADLSSADPSARGVFSFRLGAVTPDFAASPFVTLFAPGAQSGESGCAFTAQPGSHRLVHVSVKKSTDATYEALGPDTKITSVPLAKIAENALALQGVGTSGLLLVNGSSALQQTNVEEIFSLLNFPKLQALLNGTSAAYLTSTPTAPVGFNGQRLTGLTDPVDPQDAATKHYADTTVGGRAVDLTAVGPMTGNNNTLLWDATANKWVAGAINTAPTGAAGGDLAGTYPNPTIKNDAVTAAKIASTGGGPNRLLITDPTTGASIGYAACALNEIYAWTATGWACTTVTALAPVTSVAGRTGAITLTAGDIGGLGTAALYDYGTGANQIPRLDAQGALPAIDGSHLTGVNAVQMQGRAIASTLPTPGQVLGWNGGAWFPMNAAVGTVTNVAGGVGLVGGPITTAGSLAVDVGTTANKIVQLDSSARLFALDGSQLYNVNAAKIASRPVSATNPVNNQVLGWNQTVSQWEPQTSSAVTYVSMGNGLLGGVITSIGTIAVDVGTAPNKILQLGPSAKIPAVDASQLFNVNASRIASRTVANVDPLAGQVLGWNSTSSQWEPSAGNANSVTRITSGPGLLGGPITSTGSLYVDSGTNAFQIVALDANAFLPALDGNKLFNVHAAYLQSRMLSSATPGDGDVLSWNQTTSLWAPTQVASVRSIYGGTGLLGGPITLTGTLAVDVGTTANKILQLDPNGKIPAVDGSQLLKVNAALIGNHVIATTDPTANGQVLAWNTTTSAWVPAAPNSGTVTSVTAGVGLTGGPITTSGSLSVDIGSSASKIPALNSSAQLALGDGTVTAPTYSFYGSTATGFFRTGGDLGVSLNGSQQFTFRSNGSLGIGTTASTLALEVNGTGASSAILLPRDSVANRPAGANGALRYATDLNKFEGYQNGAWTPVVTGSASLGQVPVATATGIRGTTYLRYDETAGLVVNGTSTNANTLNVSGVSNLNGATNANGTTTLTGDLVSRGGTTTISNTLAVTGSSTFAAALVANGTASFRGLVVQSVQTATTAIDGSTGNVFTGNNTCVGGNKYNVTNMVNGGTYTIVNTDSGTAKCDFASGSGTSYTFAFMPANDVRVGGSQTIYNLLVVNNVIYISWSSGFQ